MKAIQFSQYGEPDVLELVEVDIPAPGPGEIRIAVAAVGVNGIDWKIRAGYAKAFMSLELPAGTGLDAAGTVTAVGPGVAEVVVGDDVLGHGRDTLAEEAILTSWVKKTEKLSFVEAAGYPLPVETAFRMLELAQVSAGQTIVISGASGGVGTAAIQLAVHRGANVIATASPANHDYLRGLGAIPLSYGPDLADRVRAAVDYSIDAGLDVSGHGVLEELISLTGDPSKVVTIADFGGAEFGVISSLAAEDFVTPLKLAASLSEQGTFQMPVARSFPLSESRAAHASCAQGHIAGRLVVTVP